MNDLLVALEEAGIGIEVGRQLLNALAFADDLALIAMDEKMVDTFLTILEKWCQDNDFDVNLSKSGYFIIAKDDQDREFNFNFLGKPFKRIEHFKYLGFLLTNNGSWNEFYEMLINRAKGKLAQCHHFFNSEDISFGTKINIARSLVLSSLTYGSDFIATVLIIHR